MPCQTVLPMPNKLLLTLCLAFIAPLLAPLAQADDATPGLSPRPTQWAQSIDPKYNLYKMTPTLYRSKLPDAQALPLLQKLGVVTVIDFLKESDSSWLSSPEVTQVQIPLRTVHIDDADILTSLRAIQAAELKGPVLIHCKHGLDRTGIVSAMYRVVVQGWSKEAALDEMTQGGFGDIAQLKYAIKYLKGADAEALRSALASGACSTSPFAFCAMKALFKSAGAN